jgi:hypothetical protein
MSHNPTAQAVVAYRLCYLMCKAKFARWTITDERNRKKRLPAIPPFWYTAALNKTPSKALEFLVFEWSLDLDALLGGVLFEPALPITCRAKVVKTPNDHKNKHAPY